MLARACGRILLLVFLVNVVLILFPLNLSSPEWGIQLSSRIVDTSSLPLVGVAMLCAAAFSQPMPDPETAPLAAMTLDSRRAFMLQCCLLGAIGLLLLAVWQLPLLLGSTGLINQRSLGQASGVSPLLREAEQSIRQASAIDLEQRWQQFIAAGAPGLTQPVRSTEQKRQALLAGLRLEQQQVERSISAQGMQARFAIVRETLRRIALCLIYATGFFTVRRAVLWGIRTPASP